MLCIGDDEFSAVTSASRQNESHPMAEVGSVNTRLKTITTVTTVIGAVLLGGLAWALVWAITKVQVYRGLGILIGAAVGAVLGARHELLILRIVTIAVLNAVLLVVCVTIIIIAVRAAVIMKRIEIANIGISAIFVLLKGKFLVFLDWMRDGFWQRPSRYVLYFGGGATVGIILVALNVAVNGVPIYPAVMTLVSNMVVLLISIMAWAATFRKCAPIFALESNNAVMKAVVILLYTMGFCAAVVILLLSLCKIIDTCIPKCT